MRRDRLHEKRPAVATIAKQPEPEIEAQPASPRPHSALPNGQPYAFGTWTTHNVTMSLSAANAISEAGVRATFYAVDNAESRSACRPWERFEPANTCIRVRNLPRACPLFALLTAGCGSAPKILAAQERKAVFQIRSSWAQFCRFLRFWRVEKSISCVFSTAMNIPTPPASKILTYL